MIVTSDQQQAVVLYQDWLSFAAKADFITSSKGLSWVIDEIKCSGMDDEEEVLFRNATIRYLEKIKETIEWRA
jgi:hypothetical protein